MDNIVYTVIIFGSRFYLVLKISFKILAAITAASKAKYDGLLIYGDFNLPSLSWSIEKGLPFPNTISPGSSVSNLYCNVFVSLGLFQNVKHSTFHKHDGDPTIQYNFGSKIHWMFSENI